MLVGARTARNGCVLIAARLSTRLIDLAAIFILARVLVPSDFGLVAIAASVVTILETALELPIYQILVRLPEQRKSHFDTAFTLSALRGLLLSLVAIGLAVPVSVLYDDARLVPLVCCFGMGPVFRSLSSPRLAQYHKDLNFSRDVIIDISSKVVSFMVSVGVAINTDSYWAIPIGAVGCTASIAGISYILAPFRPSMSLSEMSVFLHFMKFSSASQLISAVNWQSERLILGKLQSPANVGLFTTANDIAVIMLNSVFVPIGAPLLAAFSHQISDRAKFRHSYAMTANTTAMIGLPILVGQALVADLLIRIVLGEKFLGSVWLFQWLSISLIPTVFVVPSSAALIAVDEMHLLVRRHGIEFCIKLPILIVGFVQFGFPGLIAARLVSELVTNVYLAFAIQKILGLSIFGQLFGAWRSIVSAAAMAAAILPLRYGVMERTDVASAVSELIAVVALAAGVYIGLSLVLWTVSGRPKGAESVTLNVLRKFYESVARSDPLRKRFGVRSDFADDDRYEDAIFDDLRRLMPARGSRRRRWRLSD